MMACFARSPTAPALSLTAVAPTSGVVRRIPVNIAADLPIAQPPDDQPENLEQRARYGVALDRAGEYARSIVALLEPHPSIGPLRKRLHTS